MLVIRGRSSEVVEVLDRRKYRFMLSTRIKWRGASAKLITGQDSKYKFLWVDSNSGNDGGDLLLAE